ncbi:uncharacterized protein METZ01_LOCUS359981, partial [marine metagenome]
CQKPTTISGVIGIRFALAKTAVQLRTPPPIYLTQNFTNT